MLRVNQVKLRTGHTAAELKRQAASILRVPEQNITELKIIRQSIDARKKPVIFYSYSVDVAVKDEDRILHRFRGKENLVCRSEGPEGGRCAYRFPTPGNRERKAPVVIVGTGPAGLFCGYFLALHGYRPILLERGKCVEERKRDVEVFWENGKLNPASNVQFGEGGAGTFSDGKLNTLVKDRDGRNRAVLETFVRFGAKESICYEAKPHIGTDVLCDVVRRMREEIIRLGGKVFFESRVADIHVEAGRVKGVTVERPAVQGERSTVAGHSLECGNPMDGACLTDEKPRQYLECGQLVLAIGHSARDTFSMLLDRGVPMEAKSFAVGLRVEHSQRMIDISQYGTSEPGGLGAAPYKVTAKARDGRGVYSFCMCPGGYVVNASSEENRTAVNGMSYSARDGKNANSAIIVTVTPDDFESEHPLAGIAFQRRLEERAYAVGGGKIPVQRYGDFKRCVESKRHVEGDGAEGIRERAGDFAQGINGQGINAQGGDCQETDAQDTAGKLYPQCKGAWAWADVSRILPKSCNQAILEGMEVFGRQIAGFDSSDACLSGVESRTSSPVRIHRDEQFQSEIRGLYPCGEGAGYAGGIVSAAMDGIRVAEAIAREYAP
ncbi:NAD(P)/FAD-dependent oxidoreductase [uncultured Acetatifactor sp.]|uniref:NAD(P)/FAD-dependent oxidoreductase n=1 Tax=uncultured Acetatifactor sp. TaxID=1671927 RepID=UPI00260DD58F|nr:FAD-dependent oxidoreductase [uncultured Acetatifactor sp.]